MKKIGIDIDGVLRDVSFSINKVFKTYYPEYITNDPQYNYDFPHIRMPLKEKLNIIFNEYPEDVFLKAKPYLGAVSQFNFLKKWGNSNNIKLVCVTNQETHLISLSYLWLGKYNFAFEELHITKNKSSIGLDYLIDDDVSKNYEDWINCGNPEKNFFLMDRDWNKEKKVTNRINKITDIIKLIVL